MHGYGQANNKPLFVHFKHEDDFNFMLRKLGEIDIYKKNLVAKSITYQNIYRQLRKK